MIFTYATSSLFNQNNVLVRDEMAYDEEWEILKDYEENINSEYSILKSTNLKFSEEYISGLNNFESTVNTLVSEYSGSYDSYVGRYIIDGNERHKDDLSNVDYFDKLKSLYKNWKLKGYKTSEILPDYPNNFNDYIYDIENINSYSINNEINLMYECNISGSKTWKDLSNIEFKKETFDPIEDLEKNKNYIDSRWIWNVKINTNCILGTSDYFMPKTYPYDWAINRPALISWYDSNRSINISSTSSLYVPGHRGSLLDSPGGAPKRIQYKYGKYVYTFESSSYNLFQDYTSSFSPNGTYNSKSEIIKYDLYNSYFYLNFGSGEQVPIPILSENIAIIPHEDNIYTSRISEFQSSSIKTRQVQLITSNPFLKISTNFNDDIPFRVDIRSQEQNLLYSGTKNKDLDFEIVHNGKVLNINNMSFDLTNYTTDQNMIYKEIEINFYCRDWSLKTDENIKKSISTIL